MGLPCQRDSLSLRDKKKHHMEAYAPILLSFYDFHHIQHAGYSNFDEQNEKHTKNSLSQRKLKSEVNIKYEERMERR